MTNLPQMVPQMGCTQKSMMRRSKVTFPIADTEDLQPLLAACSPARFGKGRRTVLDPDYRNALTLPAQQVALGLGQSLPTTDMMAQIKRLLMPAAYDIRAEPYALNIYSQGGFFKAHQDTPRGPDMFGSLVVCLPAEFSGGELVVCSPDQGLTVTHDWGAANLHSSSSLAWVAMYSDCQHEVLPVHGGHRVTLTYNLFQVPCPSPATSVSTAEPQDCMRLTRQAAAAAAAASASAALPDTVPHSESPFCIQLRSALHDAAWCPKGVTLGFALEHQYAVIVPPSGLCPSRRRSFAMVPSAINVEGLKGNDLLLYQVAAGLGLATRLVPVVQLSDTANQLHDDNDDDDASMSGDEEQQPLQQQAQQIGSELLDMPGAAFSHLAVGRFAAPASRQATGAHTGSNSSGSPTSSSTSSEQEEDGRRVWDADNQTEANFVASCFNATADSSIMWIKPPGQQHMHYKEKANAWGNDCWTKSWYVAVALLVEVPEADAAVRVAG